MISLPGHSSINMKTSATLSAKGWVAVALVACAHTAFALSSGQILLAIVAFCTAGIAAFDSTHIHLPRYKTWLSYGPIGLFVVCGLFWPFALIWYFIVRIRIARCTMPMRDDWRPRHVAA
jgi:hypothetical protein